jgi:hypothetical protein
MSLFFPPATIPTATIKPPATVTLTLEKALADAFILAIQGEMGSALTVTNAQNFDGFALPACFVKATRQTESITNSGIFQFSLDVVLAVQADDSDPQALESLWSEVLCVTHDIFGLREKLNSIRPQYCYVYGLLRNGAVAQESNDRHFLRSVSLTVHAALVG